MAFSSGRGNDGRNYGEFEKQRITWSYWSVYYLGLVQERSLYMTPPPQVLEQSDHWDHADHWPWTALGPCSPNLTHWPLRHHWRNAKVSCKRRCTEAKSLWCSHRCSHRFSMSLFCILRVWSFVSKMVTWPKNHYLKDQSVRNVFKVFIK